MYTRLCCWIVWTDVPALMIIYMQNIIAESIQNPRLCDYLEDAILQKHIILMKMLLCANSWLHIYIFSYHRRISQLPLINLFMPKVINSTYHKRLTCIRKQAITSEALEYIVINNFELKMPFFDKLLIHFPRTSTVVVLTLGGKVK